MKEMIIDYTQQAFPFFLAAAVAFAISCILTPAAIRIAPKIGAMDIPKDNRRMHKKAMPRFGGMAISLERKFLWRFSVTAIRR